MSTDLVRVGFQVDRYPKLGIVDKALRLLFEQQFGVISRAQALAHGESHRSLSERIRDGEWHRPVSGIYQPAGSVLSFSGRLSACLLKVGTPMAFAAATAAAIWRLPGCAEPDSLQLVVPRSRAPDCGSLAEVQRRDALMERVHERDGWPVVPLDDAVVGVASSLAFGDLAELVQQVVSLRLTTSDRLTVATARGLAGSTALRAAVGVSGDGHGSKWERRLARLLIAGGLPPPSAQFRVHSGAMVAYVDLAYPQARLAIEVDGYVAHTRPETFRYDRARQNQLVVSLRWQLLRYTPYEIATRPDTVVAEIARALGPAA